MTIDQIRARRYYLTNGCPGMGGNRAVAPERVYVVGYARDVGASRETWLHVRFDDGGRLVMHPSALRVAP